MEVTPFGGDLVFRLSVSSLGDISLASSGEYLVLLTNITPHVAQREIMEEVIRARTAALEKEKRQLEEMNITRRPSANSPGRNLPLPCKIFWLPLWPGW